MIVFCFDSSDSLIYFGKYNSKHPLQKLNLDGDTLKIKDKTLSSEIDM
jgi:hypothetical protein